MLAIDWFFIPVIWHKHTTCLSTDKRVLDKMTELANAGIRRVPEIWHKHTTCLSTDKRVLDKMTELANAGIRRVPEMQRHIKQYV